MSLAEPALWRGLAAALALAVVAGPLGCLVVWRRLAYFGAAVVHNAFLGIALALMLHLPPQLGVAAVAVLIAGILVALQQRRGLADDARIGILAHGGMALGLVLLGFLETPDGDLLAYVFGDIGAVSTLDLAWIYGGGALALAVLAALWRWLVFASVSAELAAAEGVPELAVRLAALVVLALLAALAMELVGVLLVMALLIIPAATARRLAATPERMAASASLVAAVAVALGWLAAALWAVPVGPAMALAATVLFALAQLRAPRAAG